MKSVCSLLLCAFLVFEIALVSGCSSTKELPPWNLNTLVQARANADSNELAPWSVPASGASTELMFTSDRLGTQDVWRIPLGDATPATKDPQRVEFLSDVRTNDGAVTFATSSEGFFATNGAVGSMDIYSFTDFQLPSQHRENLGTSINSQWWDSHPSAASKDGNILLIFSSDRPADGYGKGYSKPYRAVLDDEGDVKDLGNRDLYFVFRINGTWGKVRNFSQAADVDVNSSSNEQSPYLFCGEFRPMLFFSSDKSHANIEDLYQAELDVDYGTQSIYVRRLEIMEKGDDRFNSAARDMFPFIPRPYDRYTQQLYFSSNRDKDKRTVRTDSSRITYQSAGGFDIYRMPVSLECRPPEIRYEVHVVDRDNPASPVKDPYVEMRDAAGGTRETHTENPAVFTLTGLDRVHAFGGSHWNQMACSGECETVHHYYWQRPVTVGPRTVTKTRTVIDTIRSKARDSVMVDSTTTVETVPISSLNNIRSAVDERLTIAIEGNSCIVTRVHYTRTVIPVGGKITYRSRSEKYTELVLRDSLETVSSNAEPAPSVLSQIAPVPAFTLSHDTTIVDTVYLSSWKERFPPCHWEFTKQTEQFNRPVPWFQTDFWEVNTSTNLERHLREFRSGVLQNCYWIELHAQNSDFGRFKDMTDERYQQRQERRQRLIDRYRQYATMVDQRLNDMAKEIVTVIIPKYLEISKQTQNNKLIIQVHGWCDYRQIAVGTYTSTNPVAYASTAWVPGNGDIQYDAVAIAPGTAMDNAILSQLRAWYGFQELRKRLDAFPEFRGWVSSGLIAIPDCASGEFDSRMEKAQIGFFIKGRGEDPLIGDTPSALAYTRRVEVIIDRVTAMGRRLIKQECCCEDEVPKDMRSAPGNTEGTP